MKQSPDHCTKQITSHDIHTVKTHVSTIINPTVIHTVRHVARAKKSLCAGLQVGGWIMLSTDLVGSSRKKRLGSFISSIPIETRFFCPPLMPFSSGDPEDTSRNEFSSS
jgi:hypothetical protein